MANSSMQTLAWSCDEATWHNHRKLSCRSFTSRHLRIGSKTWGILTILRFIHIWFHVVLGSSSWIIWLWNGHLISSKIQFLHSFNQFKRLRHVPKQTMAKETLLEPHAYRRLRNDMKSTWIPEMQSEDMCKQRHLLNVLSAKIPNDFFKSFSSASRRGMLHPPFKNNSFLGCTSKFESPFLSRGFVHSWWPHIKLSHHSWLLYVEFRLSICTRLALSEPTLLQCSFGGTRWRTLEVCRQ